MILPYSSPGFVFNILVSFLSRYRHVDFCLVDVGKNGYIPGNAVQTIWKTLKGGSLLQCEFFFLFQSVKSLRCFEKCFTSLLLHSTVCLCQAFCSCPQTSIITASTSARAVSPSSQIYVVLEKNYHFHLCRNTLSFSSS